MAASTKKKTSPKKNRKLQKPEYASLRLQKRIKPQHEKLPSAFAIFRMSLRHLQKHWRLFLGITLVYMILTLVLVKGLGVSTDIQELKASLEGIFEGGGGQLVTGFTLFGLLVGNAGSASTDVASAYQSILLIIISLVVIWALRQTYAGNKTTVKESFYKGMYPLIPFIFVLIIIGIQFIPFAVGNFIYAVVIGNGIAVTLLEKVIWALLFGLLALLSLYMVSSSIFAMYIVTLPDRRPLQSLRSARELVRFRRWTILRKVLFLPLVLLLLAVFVMVPIILWLTFLAEWLFLFLTMFSLVIAHGYVYKLYRELL